MRVSSAFLRYAAVGAVATAAHYALLAAGVALKLHYLVAQVLATGLVLVATFVINRHWTFAAPGSG